MIGRANSVFWLIRRLIDALLYSVIIWVLIFLAMYDSAVVYDVSMQPTLNSDSGVVDTDMVYYNRLASAKKGDIVIVDADGELIIKRLIATGGDRIRYDYEEGEYRLYINNTLVTEDYVKETITKEKLLTSGSAARYKDVTDISGYNPLGGLKGNQPDRFDGLGNYVVADDEVFVMGDNRLHSTDSKSHGGYKASSIVGVVEMVITSDDNAVEKLFNFVLG